MKKFSVFFANAVIAILLCALILGSCEKGDKPAEDAMDSDSSYAFGMLMASQMNGPMGLTDLRFDYEAFKEGFKAYNEAAETRLSVEQAGEKIEAVVSKKQAETDDKMWIEGEKNRAEGEAFLLANKTKSGVITTASGLQYEVVIQGNGNKPVASDVVRVHYEGKLIDGTVFDSSYSRGSPIEFPLDRVIPGWTEGVQLMNEGSTFNFFIPSDLGYGPGGGGGAIPPNATLIFKVELISIVKQENQ